MIRTPIFRSVPILSAAAVLLVFASVPATAQAILINDPFYRTTWAITPSEIVRVCLVGLTTRRPSAAINWGIGFLRSDGELVQAKEVRVPQQGFRCLDTTPEELRLAGFEAEPSGRIQFGLQIARQELVPLVAREKPEKIVITGNGYHSVETIDLPSQATKSSLRFRAYPIKWEGAPE